MANCPVNREGLELLANSSIYTDSYGSYHRSYSSDSSPEPAAGGLRHFGNFAQGLDQISGSLGSCVGSSPSPSPPGGFRATENVSHGLTEISGESFIQSGGSSPIPGCVQACAHALSGHSIGIRSSISAPLMGETMPSQGQSLPLPARPATVKHIKKHVSAPQPNVHTFNLTPDGNNPSFANVILNFNYGMGAEWGQAKRLPGQQYGVSADSIVATPSFKLHPDLHSTPVHPVDPNKTPSSLFDPTPPSPGFKISETIEHMFDSKLLRNAESLEIPTDQFKSLICEPTPNTQSQQQLKTHNTTFNVDKCSCISSPSGKVTYFPTPSSEPTPNIQIPSKLKTQNTTFNVNTFSGISSPSGKVTYFPPPSSEPTPYIQIPPKLKTQDTTFNIDTCSCISSPSGKVTHISSPSSEPTPNIQIHQKHKIQDTTFNVDTCSCISSPSGKVTYLPPSPSEPTPNIQIQQKHKIQDTTFNVDTCSCISSPSGKVSYIQPPSSEPTPYIQIPPKRKIQDTTFNIDTCSCISSLSGKVSHISSPSSKIVTHNETFIRPSENTCSVEGNTTYVVPKDRTIIMEKKTSTTEQRDCYSDFRPQGTSSFLQETANNMLAVVDSMSMQERQHTVSGLRSFQQKRRKIVSQKAQSLCHI